MAFGEAVFIPAGHIAVPFVSERQPPSGGTEALIAPAPIDYDAFLVIPVLHNYTTNYLSADVLKVFVAPLKEHFEAQKTKPPWKLFAAEVITFADSLLEPAE